MNKLFKNYLLLFFAALSVLVVGCKDDEDPIVDTEPTISSVSPDEGAPGTTVTISGTNLDNATAVTFGNETATVTNNTATSITTTVPANATAGSTQISVTTAGGTATTNFTVLAVTSDEPTITAVAPITGGAGTNITVTGTNFTGATGVTVGDDEFTADDITIDEAGENITFSIPMDATEGYTGPVTVTTAGGTATSPEEFNFTFDPAVGPTVTAVTPENMTGAVGDEVTITGTNLEGATVYFMDADGNEVEAELDATSTTETLVFMVPEGAVTGPITVRTAQGAVQTEEFTVGAAQEEATITSIYPASAAPGTTVTITGTNFTGATGVTVGEAQLGEGDFEVSDDGTTITFVVPEDADDTYTGPVTVTTGAGDATSPEGTDFTFNAQAPGFTSFDVETGVAGEVIVITGTNLLDAEVFFMNAVGEEVQADVEATSSTDELVVTIPEDAVTGPIIIRTVEGEVQTTTFTIEEEQEEAGAQYYTGEEPGENLSFTLYDDEVAEEFELWSWGGVKENQDAASTDNVQSGTAAIYVPYSDAWEGFQLGADPVFDLAGYETLVLSIYGGADAANVQVYIVSSEGQGETIPLTVTEGAWRTYEIPLSDLGNPANINELVVQNQDASANNVIYIDNIGLR